jgi:hypothetical protein
LKDSESGDESDVKEEEEPEEVKLVVADNAQRPRRRFHDAPLTETKISLIVEKPLISKEDLVSAFLLGFIFIYQLFCIS